MGLTWKPPWEPPWNRTWNLTTDGFGPALVDRPIVKAQYVVSRSRGPLAAPRPKRAA